jgi:hypothetical protein
VSFLLSYRDDRFRAAEQGRSRDVRVDAPSWSDIESAIGRMDDKDFTSVLLESGSKADPRVMALSGGREGRVICSISRPEAPDGPDERFLSEPARGDELFTQRIAGVATDLPSRLSADRGLALRAARYFHDHDGAEDPDLTWESV